MKKVVTLLIVCMVFVFVAYDTETKGYDDVSVNIEVLDADEVWDKEVMTYIGDTPIEDLGFVLNPPSKKFVINIENNSNGNIENVKVKYKVIPYKYNVKFGIDMADASIEDIVKYDELTNEIKVDDINTGDVQNQVIFYLGSFPQVEVEILEVTVDNEIKDYKLEKRIYHNEEFDYIEDSPHYRRLIGVNGSNVDKNEIVYNIKSDATVYNNTGHLIDEVYLVRGDKKIKIANNIKQDESIDTEWLLEEKYPVSDRDFQKWASPYFVIVVDGDEIEIDRTKMIANEIQEVNEELHINSVWTRYGYMANEPNVPNDDIVFYYEDGEYFYSPQYNYLDREINEEEYIKEVEYIYLHKVKKWMRQREGQLLFGVSLDEDELNKYYPEFDGELGEWGNVAMVSSETIYLEDYSADTDFNSAVVTEIKNSDKITKFTADDVMVVNLDGGHIRDVRYYFRYKDKDGKIHRQYISEQMRDGNNNSTTNEMLTVDDEYYTLIEAE